MRPTIPGFFSSAALSTPARSSFSSTVSSGFGRALRCASFSSAFLYFARSADSIFTSWPLYFVSILSTFGSFCGA